MRFLDLIKRVVGLAPMELGIIGGIGDALFGEAPKAKIKNEDITSDDQREVRWMLSNLFQGEPDERIARSTLSPNQGAFVGYDQPIVGEMSALESLSLAGIEQMVANQLNPPEGQQSPTAGDAATVGESQQAYADILTRGPEDFERYFQDAVYAPLFEQFTEEILPEVSARNAGRFFGSERMRQDEVVTEDLSEALASSRGQLAFEAQENQLNRVLDAIGLAPQMATLGATQQGAEMGLLERGMAAGAVPREVETSQRLAAYQEFLRKAEHDRELINQMIRFALQPTSETVAISEGGQQGLLGPFLGAIAQGGGGGRAGGAGGTQGLILI